MNSTQLSMFSDDNAPDKDLEENKKKKTNTGPLNKNPDQAPETEPKQDQALRENNVKDVPAAHSEEIEKNSGENLHSTGSGLTQANISENKKKNQKDISELSSEDIAVQKIDLAMKEKGQLNDQERLEYFAEIKKVALTCYKCRLSETRTKVVFGTGNPDAMIMIIGEGPGEQEDKTGIPFVGRAGQLLDKIMESANIRRDEDVYIANVVKCRPPGNRVPMQDEVEACSVYLEKQLELTKASIILLTGATAMKAILNSSSPISKVRGEWIEWKGRWVMPIFHPSYLLRNQSREVGSPKWLMWQDIKKVKQKFDELKGKSK
jgi:uracil-DNA glycosylase family 4